MYPVELALGVTEDQSSTKRQITAIELIEW